MKEGTTPAQMACHSISQADISAGLTNAAAHLEPPHLATGPTMQSITLQNPHPPSWHEHGEVLTLSQASPSPLYDAPLACLGQGLDDGVGHLLGLSDRLAWTERHRGIGGMQKTGRMLGMCHT